MRTVAIGMLAFVRLFNLTEQFCRACVVEALKNSILLECCVSIVQGDERQSEIVMRGCIVGLLANGSLILSYGFSVTLELVQRVSPLVVSFRVFGA